MGGTNPRHVLRYERGRDGDSMTATPQLALPLSVKETGEIRVYRMTLPYLPPSKNEYDNWLPSWKSSAKKKWVRDIAQECEAQMMPKGILKIGLAATLIFPSERRRDISNYAQTLWNFVPDALQYCGVLVDDREGRVQFGPNLGVKFAYDTRRIADSHRKRTVIDIAMRVI